MKLRPTAALLSLALLAGISTAAMAQNLFSGAWKLNPSKSHLAGANIKFIPAVGNAIQLSAHGTQYSFRVDGKDYRMASGDLASWTQPAQGEWKTRYKRPNGKLLKTSEWTLSSGGRALTVVTKGVKPDGQSYTNTLKYTRTGGAGQAGSPAGSSPPGASLLGSWKSISVELSSPNEMVISEYGLGGLSIKIPAEKLSLLAAFDGKDVVPSGPDVPPGLTVALMRIGPSSFRLVRKINGMVTYSARFRVSKDGSTMTETGNSPGDPAQTAVWQKE